MIRKLLALVCVLTLTGVALADEIKGKVKSVDAAKNTITVTVGDKEQTVDVPKDARIFTLGKAKKGQAAPEVSLFKGLEGIETGSEVTITTEKKDGKETAKSIKVEQAAKKKKDK